MKYDVLCAGGMVMDLLAGPVKTEMIFHGHAQAGSFSLQSGGDALNQAMIVKRLGGQVALVSQTGTDVFGNALLDDCRKSGIDVSCVRQLDDGAINVAVVLVDESGERRFVGNRENDFKKMTADIFDFDQLPDARVFSFGSLFLFPFISYEELASVFADAKSRGMITSLDVKIPRRGGVIDDISSILQNVDYMFPNDEEAAMITGKSDLRSMADDFLLRGVKNIIIKTGGDGCFFKSAAEEFLSPALPGVNCIDTTGAGDSFIGAFLTALVEGKSHRDCCAFANAAASLTVEHVGALTGIKNRGLVDERFEKLKAL